MAERDDMDRLPSISASPDDGPDHRDARREARRDGNREQAPAPARAAAPAAARTGPAFPIPLIVVLGLIVAGGGWFGYVQHQQLTLAEAELSNSAARIKRLEEELNITGSTLSETSSATEEKISAQASETKKLQDSTDRNRNAINETRRALGRTDQALKATADRATALEALTAQQAKELEQQRALLARANESIRGLAASNRELVDKVNAADQTARALRASLERRVRENEEAVAAIDKFRQQLNRTISNLQGEVAALKAAQAGG
jgi:DNA repair exonuclease SbcCD ATPase subunit